MAFKIPLHNANSYVIMSRQKLDTNRTSIELRFRFAIGSCRWLCLLPTVFKTEFKLLISRKLKRNEEEQIETNDWKLLTHFVKRDFNRLVSALQIELLRLGFKITVKLLNLLALESYQFIESIITRVSLKIKINWWWIFDMFYGHKYLTKVNSIAKLSSS